MLKVNNDLEENIVGLPYKIANDLLYFDDDERGLRLYIPISIEKEVF